VINQQADATTSFTTDAPLDIRISDIRVIDKVRLIDHPDAIYRISTVAVTLPPLPSTKSRNTRLHTLL
jgi:hypothetical protein